MDINMDYSDDDNPLGVKSDFVLSLCELIMGSRDGIEAEEKSVIDRCLPLVYQKYFADPKPENMPVLGDLYDCLRKQKEPQAQRIATALEIYVNGSLKVFNHRTNVELNNRIVCFDIKELGKQLKKIGMLIVQDQVWNRVTINRGIKSTRYYIDEFHLLLKEEQTAAYSVEIWKRFRKWGGIPSGITQNIKDLLASREIENIFENSDFILMLNQAAGDRQILAKQLNISPYQLSYVTNSGEGEGLLFYGTTIIPFKDKFDKNLKLYSLMTTKPEEVENERKKWRRKSMKEIDKIRIRQWNQDNPYIQMKNLENVQPGYRVHTVNDDHHLYELPLETQNIILDWVFWNFYPAQKIYPHLTSDDLKEVLYKRTQIHLYNNQFKEAMLINGFWPRDPSELNWVFHIQASSPAIRTQADGYPGIPIIGRQELNEYRKKSCARR